MILNGDDMKRRDFSNTIAALAEFDRTGVDRDRMVDTAETNRDIYAWIAAVDAAVELVQRAFQEDTKDLNNWSHCKHVTIKDARRIVSHDGKKKTPRLDPTRHIPC